MNPTVPPTVGQIANAGHHLNGWRELGSPMGVVEHVGKDYVVLRTDKGVELLTFFDSQAMCSIWSNWIAEGQIDA